MQTTASVATAAGAIVDLQRTAPVDTVRLRESDSCLECVLRLDTVAETIGGPRDPIGVTWIDAIRYDVDDVGRVWLAPAVTDAELHVYTQPLSPARVAREGGGPREFRDIKGVQAIGEGRLWVWGFNGLRAIRTVGDSIVEETRNRLEPPITIYHVAQLSAGRLAANGFGMHGGQLRPLWLFDVDNAGSVSPGVPVDGFAVSNPRSRNASAHAALPIARADGSSGDFWVSASDRVALYRVNSEGTVLRAYTWNAPWFTAWSDDGPPRHRVMWMSTEQEDRIWLAVEVPRDFQASGAMRQAHLGLPVPPPPAVLRTTVVLLIDTATAALVGQWLVPSRMLGANPGSIGLARELPDGHMTITPVRFRLRDPGILR